jgi:oxygen-dependent protoporphyrinogen oxidase
MTTAILGAGLAGLAAALELEERGEDFVIFEKADRAGGVVSSLRREGYLLERGPRTVPSAAPVLARLIAAAGLDSRVLNSSDSASRRYVWSEGRLHAVPLSVGQLLGTSLLSVGGRIRVLGDLFIPRGGRPGETVADFVTRRFGVEACTRLADPMCAGVFAGNPQRLGIEAFARAAAIEQKYGSVLRGLSRLERERRRDGEPAHSLLSFPEGLEQLTEALATRFASRLRLGVTVRSLNLTESGISVVPEDSSLGPVEVDRVIVAVPAAAAAELIAGLAPGAAATLAGIRHVPLAVIALGYPRGSIAHLLDGFGLLCCSDSPLPEEASVLGVLFSSAIFAGRAPAGMVLLEVMVGGDRDPAAMSCSDEELYDRARRACEQALGASGEPPFRHLTRWPPVLPQYAPGHAGRIAEAKDLLRELGPIALAGNYLDGVGVEAAAASGVAAAAALL